MTQDITMTTIQEDFDRIAVLAHYGERWEHNSHYHRYLLQHIPANCKQALEIGCGVGQFVRLLATKAQDVLALDLSPEMIRIARERSTGYKHIDYQVADLLQQEYQPEQFDCIVSIATLHHLPLEETLIKLKKMLAPGGVLIILDLYQQQPLDLLTAPLAIIASRVMQYIKNGRVSPAERQAAREAWERHAVHDTYMTISQIRQIASRTLPEDKERVRIRKHLFWRYSLIWKKPELALFPG